MVPHFPAIGSGGVPPVPPTIIMSALKYKNKKIGNVWKFESMPGSYI
jgi:hypothetical protein